MSKIKNKAIELQNELPPEERSTSTPDTQRLRESIETQRIEWMRRKFTSSSLMLVIHYEALRQLAFDDGIPISHQIKRYMGFEVYPTYEIGVNTVIITVLPQCVIG